MSETGYLDLANAAGQYMQTFVRSRQSEFVEIARECSPTQGWHGAGVKDAHDAAMVLWHYTDDNFLNCRIPQDFGSPASLTSALFNLKKMMEGQKKHLEDIATKARANGDELSETVPIVHKQIVDTLFASEEALRQLADAAATLPGNNAEVVAASAPSPMEIIQEIANRFSDVVSRMKKRRKDRPALEIADEYDVQYLFQGLLTVPFIDVRPEEPTPSVAGGSGRADTLLKAERIVVEYKCTREGLGDKDLRRQIADDFILYGSHPECDKLFIFVYDYGQHISNPTGFEADMTRNIDGIDEVRIAIRR